MNRQLMELRTERLKLRQGDMELKSAITNISHDLRTPLTAICGYLDLLEQETFPQKSENYLNIIRERTDAMRALTEELFQYSVISLKEEEIKIEKVCVNDILEQSLGYDYQSQNPWEARVEFSYFYEKAAKGYAYQSSVCGGCGKQQGRQL